MLFQPGVVPGVVPCVVPGVVPGVVAGVVPEGKNQKLYVLI